MKIFGITLGAIIGTTLFFSAGFAAQVTEKSGEKAPILCLSDRPEWSQHANPEITAKRMAIYRNEMGAHMLRAALPWALMEPKEGQWDDTVIRDYFTALKNSGLRCKLIISVVMDVPDWYLKKYPEIRLQDERGAQGRTPAPWSQDHWKTFEEKTRHLLDYARENKILDITDEVVVDLGPAGEPIYPPNWTLGPGDGLAGGGRSGEEGFFMYGEAAQKSFVSWAQKKYKTIAHADRAWKTKFKDWDAVVIPQPKTTKGPFWEDLLSWYRDAKREFSLWRIASVKEAVKQTAPDRDIPVVVYLPGYDFTPEDWQAAVNEGSGNHAVRLMIDNAFLIENAPKLGYVLQMTGAQDDPVCLYYLRMAKKYRVDTDLLWLENAGEYINASNPLGLATKVLRYDLRGMDYTHTLWLFEDDTITPKQPIFGELAKVKAKLSK